jgi:hypothetical protein
MDIDRLKKVVQKKVFILDDSLFALHSNFIDKVWGAGSIRKNYNYLKWKFKSPFQEKIPGILVCKEGDEVKAQLGLIPDKAVINGNIISCQWGCNFKALPEYEGSGVGALLDIASLEKADITFGVNPSWQSEVIKKRLGFVKLQGPRSLMFPVDYRHLILLKIPEKAKWLTGFFSRLLQVFYLLRYPGSFKKGPSELPIMRGTWIDVFEMLTRARQKIKIAHVLHDREFLEWRCNAFKNFHTFSQSIYTQGGSFILFDVTMPYLMINEFYFNNKNEALELLKECLTIAEQASCKTIKVFANSYSDEIIFKEFGFIGLRNKIRIYAYTSNKNINFGQSFHYDGYDGESNL